jgi:hypothetical protein
MPLARAGAIVDGILLLQYQNNNATTLDIFFVDARRAEFRSPNFGSISYHVVCVIIFPS